MVRGLNWWNGSRIFSISITDFCKEHFFEEPLGIRIIPLEESVGQVDCRWAIGVKLGGNPFDISSVGARRSGNHPPPLISCLAVDKDDEISVPHIIVGLLCHQGSR